ncbi:MAG: nitrite reductase, partial [Gammaproteobacteria bacterium]|nr:nitrite reductase [Gammaproteobacteria bacterium]
MSACTSPFDSSEQEELAKRLVALTEGGLPLVEDPWGWLAERLEISVDATLELLQQLQAEGAIRRIAAVPNHYRLGYRHNGMTVWDVDDTEIARLGPLIGAQPFVSHCYRRPRQESWHYNLFAMVHGRSAEEIDAYRAEIRQLLGSACRTDEMLV